MQKSIALQEAYTYPGVEIYPSCIQVKVTGIGSKAPTPSYLVSFPGAYTASTPGIVYDVYSNRERCFCTLHNRS
jgi:hypothetical protein